MRDGAPLWVRADRDAKALDDVKDDEIASLPMEQRSVLADIWQKRAGFELQVAAGFSAISTSMFEFGADPYVVKIVGRAVGDEVRHAEISADLAARYRGDAVIWPGRVPVHTPRFEPAAGALRLALYMIAMSCINETVACSVLEAAIQKTKSPLVKAALSTILSDEIDHARAGWAHLASAWVTPEMKVQLGDWLKRMLSAKMRELVEEESPLPGEAFPSHGMLARPETRRIVRSTLDDVIFAGFEASGIDASAARAWAVEALPI